MRRAVIIGVAAVLAAACGDATPVVPGADAGTSRDGGVEPPRDGGMRDGGPSDERYLTRLETAADLAEVSSSTVPGVKYLFNREGLERQPPLTADCYFQNMRMFTWHVEFLHSFDEYRSLSYQTYLDLVLRAQTRRWWGGSVRAYPGVMHPDRGTLGVVTFVVYGEPGQVTATDVVEVDGITKRCMPFAADMVVFVPEGPHQKAMVQRDQTILEDAGVSFLFPEQLIDGLSHEVYSPGEGYGTLRVVPAGQPLDDHGPRDIVIVESAPNDISVVQGLITKDPQSPLSHTNLRLIEKGVPSVAVPRIYDTAYVATLANQLVHLVAREDRFVLEPARLEDAEAFWEARRPVVPAPEADLSVIAIAPYDTIGHEAANAYGAKAANIAELDEVLPAENRPAGFGIPFSKYVEHVEANGIDEQIDAVLTDPRVATDAAFKRSELKRIRNLIEDAPFDPALLDALEATIVSVFGAGARSTRVRFRSSTNVEDLDALTGAGLYDSKTGCIEDDRDGDVEGPSRCLTEEERVFKQAELDRRIAEQLAHPERLYLQDIIDDLEGDLLEERPVARAVKKVWASLWNVRAYDEREYYGIDHRLAYMGIAVNLSFTLERASAVAITHLNVDAGDPLYRLSSQIGDESVVRPADPTVIAESLTFRRSGEPPAVSDVEIQVRSSLLEPTEQVWPSAELDILGGLLFSVQDHFETLYPELVPLSFDVEIKYTRDGRVEIKQVRPFVSTEP